MADSLEDDLSRLCRMFEEAEDATREARQRSERDRDYFDLKQWTADETAALQRRKQPVITFDRTKRKVLAIMGLEKQTRKDPKAYPRNPQDEGAAQAATDAIRYVCDDSRWDDKRSHAAENLIVEGTCAIKVGVKQTRNGIDPDIARIAWDRFFADPHSSDIAFDDASYMGEVIWMDVGDAKRMFPGREQALDTTLSSEQYTETYDDKPRHRLWADFARKRVRVVEMYYRRGGEWWFCIFTKGGHLTDPQPSPYLDEEGRPENPIKAISLYIDRDNNRYGDVRAMIGPQDEINKRRSKALHLINVRQVRVGRGVQISLDEVKTEMSKPDGAFVADVGEIEVLPTGDMAAGNLQLMQQAQQEMDLLSLNAASIGKSGQDLSGRAIIAQQQGGMTEAATFLDRIRVLSLAVYRAVWCRIRQHWTAERWIRVTDNEKNVKFVGLNRPVTALEEQAKRMGVTQENIGEAPPEITQQLQAMAMDPRAQQVIRTENNVTELDVDILVDEGIDTPTLAAEQFDMLAKMLPSAPPNVQPALWQALLENSALRNKDKIAEALKQPPSPEQQMAQELQMRGAAAEVAKTESEVVLTQAKAQTEMAKPELEAAKLAQHSEEFGASHHLSERDQMLRAQAQQAAQSQPQRAA
jgi:hypothetical protein